MLLSKTKRLIQTCRDLGFKQTGLILFHRFNRERFIKKMRERALMQCAQQDWHELKERYSIDWQQFHEATRHRALPYLNELFASVDQENTKQLADCYAQDQLQALGSYWYTLDNTMWHTDIRLKQQGGDDYTFEANAFYADISIHTGDGEALKKDIKVPWELSRLQHLPVLADAYKQTGDQMYVQTFVRQVMHWQKYNPYLLGINWVCPMEVGLRAISLVIAYEQFKHASVADDFWQSYTALLYDHMIYLEHNWEWYDGRTSNHYLSDLVGYLYLCWFFKPMFAVTSKINWCVQQLCQEMSKQVFAEGTSYEGSTRYHLLVTELFYHAWHMISALGRQLPDTFGQMLQRMCVFIAWCTINEHTMITIGDDDSGKVTFAGLPHDKQIESVDGIKHYEQFGLTVYKDTRWQVSVRHHAYTAQQPSGHFHNDVGSMTLAINRIPILVDPGSYVYTASAFWRNYFRSATVHNQMSLAGKEPVPFNDRLFYLAVPECKQNLHIGYKNILATEHKLYEQERLMLKRTIYIQKNAVIIHDSAYQLDTTNEDIKCIINFTFAPHITLKKQAGIWVGYYNHEPLFQVNSMIDLYEAEGYVACGYGDKKQTTRLVGQVTAEPNKIYKTEFIFVQDPQ